LIDAVKAFGLRIALNRLRGKALTASLNCHELKSHPEKIKQEK
jgi:hypothetical protein